MKNMMLAMFMVLALSAAPAKCASDPSYQTLIYTQQGGDKMWVKDGGEVEFESGATLTLAGGSSLVESDIDLTEKSLTATYGINGGTLTLTDTSAVALVVGGGITAGTGSVGIVNATGKIPALTSTYLANLDASTLLNISSYTAGSIPNAALAGSIAPAKITGTAAIIGANTFTGAQVIVGSVQISSSTTSVLKCINIGPVDALPTTTYHECDEAWLTSDHKVYRATETVAGVQSWKAAW